MLARPAEGYLGGPAHTDHCDVSSASVWRPLDERHLAGGANSASWPEEAPPVGRPSHQPGASVCLSVWRGSWGLVRSCRAWRVAVAVLVVVVVVVLSRQTVLFTLSRSYLKT